MHLHPSASLLGLALLSVAACSGGVASPLPPGDGNIAGGAPAGGNVSSAPTSTTPPMPTTPPTATTPPNTPPPAQDAGTSDASGGAEGGTGYGQDSGMGYFIDTGTGSGSGGGIQPTGPLGSCTNPACGSTGNQCGCTATDSNGNTVQLGCQAGGECACFIDQQESTNPVPENGACSVPAQTAQLFLSQCGCQ